MTMIINLISNQNVEYFFIVLVVWKKNYYCKVKAEPKMKTYLLIPIDKETVHIKSKCDISMHSVYHICHILANVYYMCM